MFFLCYPSRTRGRATREGKIGSRGGGKDYLGSRKMVRLRRMLDKGRLDQILLDNAPMAKRAAQGAIKSSSAEGMRGMVKTRPRKAIRRAVKTKPIKMTKPVIEAASKTPEITMKPPPWPVQNVCYAAGTYCSGCKKVRLKSSRLRTY